MVDVKILYFIFNTLVLTQSLTETIYSLNNFHKILQFYDIPKMFWYVMLEIQVGEINI